MPTGRLVDCLQRRDLQFRVLRGQLIERGYRFRSESDTEVALPPFGNGAMAALDRLTGMFAFAIYDRPSETLILVRDRFGKKPLYYCWEDDHFLFASELKALLRVMRERRVDHRRLAEWALYRNVDWGSSETLIENVHSLLPGHWMELRHGRPSAPRPYYVVETQVDPALYADLAGRSAQEVTAEIETLAVTAVRDRLVSDVPVGTLCSGGIDSSLITALAARDLPNLKVFQFGRRLPGARREPLCQAGDRCPGPRPCKLLDEAEDFRANLARAIYSQRFPADPPELRRLSADLGVRARARCQSCFRAKRPTSCSAATCRATGAIGRCSCCSACWRGSGRGPKGHRARRSRRRGRSDQRCFRSTGAAPPCAGRSWTVRARGPAPALRSRPTVSSPIQGARRAGAMLADLTQLPVSTAAPARPHEHGGIGRMPHAVSRSALGALRALNRRCPIA